MLQKMFCLLKACWKGFLEGCRPYLAICSSTPIGKFRGQLATTTAVDAHNFMFPVAYGIIETDFDER
jgi:hypothetical protein